MKVRLNFGTEAINLLKTVKKHGLRLKTQGFQADYWGRRLR